jgi:hypothetical protein
MLILFCTFVSDTTKVDTIAVQQVQAVQKKFDTMNSKLDSIIEILKKDTISDGPKRK